MNIFTLPQITYFSSVNNISVQISCPFRKSLRQMYINYLIIIFYICLWMEPCSLMVH